MVVAGEPARFPSGTGSLHVPPGTPVFPSAPARSRAVTRMQETPGCVPRLCSRAHPPVRRGPALGAPPIPRSGETVTGSPAAAVRREQG